MSPHEIAEILQRRLAEVDFLTKPINPSRPGFIEFLLLKLENMKIKMYQELGHAMPHIHIDYGRQHHVASFSVTDSYRIEGSLHPKYDRSIIAWITENEEVLLRLWNEAQSGGDADYLIAQLSGHA